MNIFEVRIVEVFLKPLYLVMCFFIIQGCSDSQFEKRLADSFDTPLKSDISIEKSNMPRTIALTPNKEVADEELRKFSKVRSTKNKIQLTPSKRRSKNFTPQPYRIIIRLSGANPSAPAETVTTVLRDAGVVFEIERIERLDGKLLFKGSSTR